ncbi:MAG TPA: divalent-cation tolerance protein CutA [Candidatus Dormibacteraeota bacterium]|jgi:periplasmic divalent cation tolerance protein|nr:divalent-cation tolerance protein CutA [Candidatus Dormibacteraeota bacterium]
MPRSNSTRIVLVTCGNLIEARRIASKVVRKRLAACVTIILGPVQSVYRWKGKVQATREQLLLIKTIEKQLAPLEAEIKRLHSYEVPEIIAVPTIWGSADYLSWLEENSANQK